MPVERADNLIAAAHELAPEATFTEPWQARAFAVAVALCESGQFKWSEFQQCLIEEIGTAEAAGHASAGGPDYYRHWLSALTRLLEAKRIVAAAELATSIAQAGPPPPPQDPRGRHI
jgi:nitrile hydratase accessory protein